MDMYPRPHHNSILRHTLSRVWMLLVLLLPLITGSCIENKFDVEMDITGAGTTSYRLLWHASSAKQSMLMETVIALQGGKGIGKLPTKYPCIVYVFTGTSQQPVTAFYARRGDKIKITGKNDDPMSWRITGNDLNEAWCQWRIDHRKDLDGGWMEINQAVASYVKGHRDDELSTVLLLTTYDRRANEDEFRRLWESLDDGAKPQRLTEALSRSDISGMTTGKNESLRDFAMRAIRERPDTLHPAPLCDTLHPLRVAATILLIAADESESRAAKDTLRALARQYPDSAKRLIAHIYTDPDSVAWRMQMERDTLPGVAELWTPASLCDAELIRIGVNRNNFMIVAGSNGRQIYRGSDAARAASAFRRLMKAHKPSQSKTAKPAE